MNSGTANRARTTALREGSTSPTFERLRRAVMASKRKRLAWLKAYVWTKAWPAGLLSDDEAQQLAVLADARGKEPEHVPVKRTSVGSRPRTPQSRPRTRQWAGESWIPPDHVGHFTHGQHAVLAVIASEAMRKGVCRMFVGQVAALAGVCKSTVRGAVRLAAELHLVWSTEHRRSTWRNDANEVRIIAKIWRTWLDRRDRMAKRKKGAETRTKAQATKAWFQRKADDRRALKTLRSEARAMSEQIQAEGQAAQEAQGWRENSARTADGERGSSMRQRMATEALDKLRRRGGSNFANPTPESSFQEEYPSAAPQPSEENCPSGSFSSGGGIFDAARRAAQKLGLDPSEYGIGPKLRDKLNGSPLLDGVAYHWT